MSTIGDVSTIPAGWYPDPESNARSRWWDGTGWTASVSEPQPPAPPQESFVPQHAAPIPQAHFEQRPFVPAPAAQPFMPQQAELQRFVTQPGSQAPAPVEGTLTRRQLRELTSAAATGPSDAVSAEPTPVAAEPTPVAAEPAPFVPEPAPFVPEPAPFVPEPVATAPYVTPAPAVEPQPPVAEPTRPAHAPAHAASPIVVPSAAPGTPFGDVAVMPTYGTPVTPPAAAAAPAPSNQVSTYSAPAATPTAVSPYSGLASPSLLPQAEQAPPAPAPAPAPSYATAPGPANPFAAAPAPANPFAAAPAPANPFAAAAPAAFAAPANPFAAPVDAAPANPFAAASNPFATTTFAQGNPFAAPTEFSTTAAPAFSFDFEPVVATERGGSFDEKLPVQTGGIWFFTLVPLIQAALMYVVFVTLASEPSLPIAGGLAVLPVLLYLLAADKDRKKLDSLGHDRLTSAGWALLPLVYMVIRTVRVGGRGVPALIVWIASGIASSVVLSMFVMPVMLLGLAGLAAGL